MNEINRDIAIMEAATPLASVIPANALTPMQMINNAIERGAGLDMIQQLMTLSERWEANQARKAFDEAISAAKAEIQPIIKNRVVQFESKKSGASNTNYRHEDLSQIARQVDPILSKFGLSYRFRTTNAPNAPVCVTCIVSHRLGHCEENTLSGPRDESGNKNSLQAVGSAITYLQRYTLKASLGLSVTDDDDGRAAADDDGNAVAGGLITPEQVGQLRAALDEIGGDVRKFCEFAKVEALAQIQTAHFNRLLAAINAKRPRT